MTKEKDVTFENSSIQFIVEID